MNSKQLKKLEIFTRHRTLCICWKEKAHLFVAGKNCVYIIFSMSYSADFSLFDRNVIKLDKNNIITLTILPFSGFHFAWMALVILNYIYMSSFFIRTKILFNLIEKKSNHIASYFLHYYFSSSITLLFLLWLIILYGKILIKNN